MTDPVISGRCLCGRVSYRVTGPAVGSGYCHCRRCRRFTGTVVTNWLGIADRDLEFDGATPACYIDGSVTRGFCPACGSSPAYAWERFPDYLQLHLRSLDDPGAVSPRTLASRRKDRPVRRRRRLAALPGVGGRRRRRPAPGG